MSKTPFSRMDFILSSEIPDDLKFLVARLLPFRSLDIMRDHVKSEMFQNKTSRLWEAVYEREFIIPAIHIFKHCKKYLQKRSSRLSKTKTINFYKYLYEAEYSLLYYQHLKDTEYLQYVSDEYLAKNKQMIGKKGHSGQRRS